MTSYCSDLFMTVSGLIRWESMLLSMPSLLCTSEQLVLGGTKPAAKKWDQEWDSYVLPLLQEDMPSYLLYRLDTTNNQGYEWIFLAWSPDHSTVSNMHTHYWCFSCKSRPVCFQAFRHLWKWAMGSWACSLNVLHVKRLQNVHKCPIKAPTDHKS